MRVLPFLGRIRQSDFLIRYGINQEFYPWKRFFVWFEAEYNEDMSYLDVSLLYIITHLGRRISDFFRHWYIDGFLRSVDWVLSILEKLDKRFAVRITAKNWLQPLYQDYTVIGYIWGFIFRTIRIFIGLAVYLVFILFTAMLFAGWAAFPAFVIYQIFINLK